MEFKESNIDTELKALDQREADMKKRVEDMDILHEDIVIINRHDMDTVSWLEMDERNREGRRRSSWYGSVLAISAIDCGDTIREGKKKVLKIGDVVIFNPESAYSLNVATFPEIWILHVDSILMKDAGYDYLTQKKENLRKKHEIVEAMRNKTSTTLPVNIQPVRTRILTK